MSRESDLLAQPEQEPVAWLHEGIDETGETVRSIYHHFYEHANLIPLYTAPQKREPLSEDEIWKGVKSEHPISRSSFTLGVKFGEKEHGIGVDNE